MLVVVSGWHQHQLFDMGASIRFALVMSSYLQWTSYITFPVASALPQLYTR